MRTAHNQYQITNAVGNIKMYNTLYMYTVALKRPGRFNRLHQIIPRLERLNKALPRANEFIPDVEKEVFQTDVLLPLIKEGIITDDFTPELMTEANNINYRQLVSDNPEPKLNPVLVIDCDDSEEEEEKEIQSPFHDLNC